MYRIVDFHNDSNEPAYIHHRPWANSQCRSRRTSISPSLIFLNPHLDKKGCIVFPPVWLTLLYVSVFLGVLKIGYSTCHSLLGSLLGLQFHDSDLK